MGASADARRGADLAKTVQTLLRQGRLADAERTLGEYLEGAPADAQALYLLAVVHRYQRRYQDAEQTLDRLAAQHPEYARAYQEKGHLMRALGDGRRAIDAFARAVHLNPALLASWEALQGLLESAGQGARAAQVARERAKLAALPQPLLAVHEYIADGRWLKAEALCREFLRRAPRHVPAMRLLARIGLELGVLDDAEFLLESAVAFAPDDVDARIEYITALRKRQRYAQAQEVSAALLKHDPEDLRLQSIHAVGTMQLGDFEGALQGFDRILQRLPGDPITLTSKGHALKTSGRYQDAVDAYRAAIDERPTHGEAWYSLANLKTYRFDDADIERMRALEGTVDLSHQDRIYLSFALGKAYEDRDAYEASFAHYAQGNEAKRRASRYDAARMREELEAQARVCTAEFFHQRAGLGCAAPDPIFIVGLPRAGSTLLEQILASHSQVDGTLELPNVLALSQQLRRRPLEHPTDAITGAYPDILRELSAQEFVGFGEAYLQDTQVHRRGAPRFIDKMPNNFRHLGLIHLMLPRAKIIDARREPMACCFSGFKQLFAEGQEFSYSLSDIGQYYRDYVALMDHWDAVLPGKVLRVTHEAVVDDLESQVRRLLDFCELPFEQGCLRFWETERAVRTPSSEQVRRPIDRAVTAQWQHYTPWLGPLREVLGDLVT